MLPPLTVAQLRTVLQLPERPYEDVYIFDGTSYFDFSHREICTMLQMYGTAAGASYTFIANQDYKITAGTIDWTTPGAKKPDLFTPFTIDYTYSRLSGDTASLSVANAQEVVSQDLGSSFPWNQNSPQGNPYNALATYGALLCAAREACWSLSTTEIDLAQKSRRGAVLQDDSKKTADWDDQAKNWDMRYKRYLTMIRPGGMVRGFIVSSASDNTKVFADISSVAYETVFVGRSVGYDYDAGATI